MSAEESLDNTIKTIRTQERITKIFTSKNLIRFSGLLLLLILAFIYYKKQQI
jgi:hypothetical protein